LLTNSNQPKKTPLNYRDHKLWNQNVHPVTKEKFLRGRASVQKFKTFIIYQCLHMRIEMFHPIWSQNTYDVLKCKVLKRMLLFKADAALSVQCFL